MRLLCLFLFSISCFAADYCDPDLRFYAVEKIKKSNGETEIRLNEIPKIFGKHSFALKNVAVGGKKKITSIKIGAQVIPLVSGKYETYSTDFALYNFLVSHKIRGDFQIYFTDEKNVTCYRDYGVLLGD